MRQCLVCEVGTRRGACLQKTMFKIYNTLTRKKEIFKPVNEKLVRIYTCGPTVYDFAHIGNFRSYLTADILNRWLRYSGYSVKLVKNITDVGHLTQDDIEQGEDKILKAAKKEAKTPKQIARFYEKAFLEDEACFNILPAAVYPRATEHINEMIAITKVLLEKGLAYEKNGSVFYNISRFKNYGQLSGNTLDKLTASKRLEPHADKKNPYDFALWLKAEPDHLMQWPSPWSRGYPGWHIECSAMSMKHLSDAFGSLMSFPRRRESIIKFRPEKFQTIDFHTGGEDNIFPHHENEIAQSEGVANKKFINYWLHTKHLLVNDQKMSKSLGNFYTLRDLIDKKYNPLAFRLLLLGAHWRSQINFTFKGLAQAQSGLERITEFIASLQNNQKTVSEGTRRRLIPTIIKKSQQNFEKYMNDDLNTPQALAVVFDLIRDINKCRYAPRRVPTHSRTIYNLMLKFDQVLGLNLGKIKTEKIAVPDKVKKLLSQRETARNQKDFKKADQIRKQIEKMSFKVVDTKKGSSLKKN